MVSYSGPLWELQPVEVRARTRPTKLTSTLDTPEQQAFAQAGVDVAEFQDYMRQNNIALIVSHNVTTRDDADFQQPFNLRIPNGVQTLGASGKIYNVKYLQLFQADQLRGLGGTQSPDPGRRVLAQYLHDARALAVQPPNPDGPTSSVVLGSDGSMAAFVPARRAVTWQLTNGLGDGVVRERFWLTFQPGEIRVCASCHGVNDKDQAGDAPPMNQPKALQDLLTHWKTVINAPEIQKAVFRSAGAYDGWVLETSETSNTGGKINAGGTVLKLGDNADNKQFRAILHFNTSGLPDTAVITKVALKVKKQQVVGTNPFNTHGALRLAIRKPYFGSSLTLQSGDFQAGANMNFAGSFGATPVNKWYSAVLSSTGASFVNLSGTTQFRLYFTKDDDNDHIADFVKLYSGNASAANRPKLIVEYYVP